MLDEIFYPNVPTTNMLTAERMALAGYSRAFGRGALEVGVYCDGSLSLIAQFCDRVCALDIDPEMPASHPAEPGPAHRRCHRAVDQHAG